MNIKFLDKVCDQIISETRVKDKMIYAPFSPSPFFSFYPPLLFSIFTSFFSHCKDVYSLKNEQEIDYVWINYKKEIVDTINNKKELSYKDKRMMVYTKNQFGLTDKETNKVLKEFRTIISE